MIQLEGREDGMPTPNYKAWWRAAETHPMSFLTRAREYQKAANILFDAVDQPRDRNNLVPLSNPVYYLFTHTVELALKAFLRAHDEEVPTGRDGHALIALMASVKPWASVSLVMIRSGSRTSSTYSRLKTTFIRDFATSLPTVVASRSCLGHAMWSPP
jgi:hypothetical protein